ncbi:hypothetical protein ADK60_29840 [Streptomyces sp. XY431]|uniref:hypothetical protein n=1 Tax=Streptomyces sp. XY431 TaxID=1415562 RepID=UPI0006B01106|nr:hypothetical protein [Streptomyces sp. XY431]KOV13299.1 hypothetical protein ADK60_29840 [Streptomyces sp. XY431]
MTSIAELTKLATFGSTWAVLAVGHNVADHVFGQSDHHAANKGAPTAEDVAAGAASVACSHPTSTVHTTRNQRSRSKA